MNERMMLKFVDRHSVCFNRLQALEKEETSLNLDRFFRLVESDSISTIIDLPYQLFHIITMEWSHAKDHLVQHDA